MLLNVPPDSRGLISDKDIVALTGFKKLRDESFGNNLANDAKMYYQFAPQDVSFQTVDSNGAFGANLQNFMVEFPQKTKINCIVLKEAIRFGQTVRKFRIVFYKENKSVGEIKGTSIGRKRILTFPEKNINSFKVFLEDARGRDNISNVAAYLIDDKLVEK